MLPVILLLFLLLAVVVAAGWFSQVSVSRVCPSGYISEQMYNPLPAGRIQPLLLGVSLTTLTVDTVMEAACTELESLLNDSSFPVFGTIIAFRDQHDIQDGPGWRHILYQPEVKVQLYDDTAGRLLESVACHNERDVYRLLSALNDAEKDIRTARKTASSRSWWSGLTGRIQG